MLEGAHKGRVGEGEIFDVGFLIFPRSCGTRFRVNFARGCGPDAGRGRDARTRGCGELRNALLKKLGGTKVDLPYYVPQMRNFEGLEEKVELF